MEMTNGETNGPLLAELLVTYSLITLLLVCRFIFLFGPVGFILKYDLFNFNFLFILVQPWLSVIISCLNVG